MLLTTRDSWWMNQCEAALLAEGVALRWVPQPSGDTLLEVPDEQAARAGQILSELLGEEQRRRQETVRTVPVPGLLAQPAFALAIGLAALTLVFFWVTGSAEAHNSWHQHGALIVPRLLTGEWWRVVTAATLHADVEHAASNAGFFLVLAWAAGERLGAGLTVLAWLVTAVLGFVASILFSQALVTVGASGGLFGLLGLAAGHAVRHHQARLGHRRARLQALAGAVLLLAFTAFSPRANIAAHVGGFVTGLLLGLLAPSVPARPLIQVVAAMTVAATVLGAWWWALA